MLGIVGLCVIDAEDTSRRWTVHRYALGVAEVAELLGGVTENVISWANGLGVRDGQQFLLGPDGRPDLRVNACLGSARWRNLAEGTRRDYTYSLVVWLNFLVIRRVLWWEATEDDAEEFLFWRVTDPQNARRVTTGSFSRDMAGLNAFYRWMRSHYAVANPFDGFAAPRIARSADVKWLDPGAFARWRDLGVRGPGYSGGSNTRLHR